MGWLRNRHRKPAAKQITVDTETVVEPATPSIDFFAIAKEGTHDDFLAAWQQASEKKIRVSGLFDMMTATGDPSDQQALHRGAVEAFLDKRPENLQAILAKPRRFAIADYTPMSLYREDYFERSKKRIEGLVTRHLNELVKRSGDRDPSELIKLALAGIATNEERQRTLDSALDFAVTKYKGDEQLIGALLKAKANANAGPNGFKGYILAHAVTNGQTQEVVDLLLANGANFADTAFTMLEGGEWGKNAIDHLRRYHDKITYETDSWECKQAARALLADLEETTRQGLADIEQKTTELLATLKEKGAVLMEFGPPSQSKPASASSATRLRSSASAAAPRA